jgi:hypothetical protein
MRRLECECEREAAGTIAAALLLRRLDPFRGTPGDRLRPCADLDDVHSGLPDVATYRRGRWAGTGRGQRPAATGERP